MEDPGRRVCSLRYLLLSWLTRENDVNIEQPKPGEGNLRRASSVSDKEAVDQDFLLFEFHVTEFIIIYSDDFFRCYSPGFFMGAGRRPGKETELTGGLTRFRN